MTKILEGKKTYIGIIVTLIGITGLSQYITGEETSLLLNSILEVVGILITLYGRIVTKK